MTILTNTQKINALRPLSQIVKDYGLLSNKKHSKSLGQNFLLDYSTIKKIVAIAGNLEDQTVVEIGPGPGGLTRAILEKKPKTFHVVEMDKECIKVIYDLKKEFPEISIHHQDALTFDIADDQIKAPIHILSNLPYHIGTELLMGWLQKLPLISSMTLMFQKEVADRIMAGPHHKEYGRLSIVSQYCCIVEHGLDLPPHLFTPAPKVDSSVIKLTPRQNVDLDLLPYLENITKHAFGQRRKMIRSSLKNVINGDELESLDILPTNRAENLTLDDFIRIAKYISTK